MYINKEKFNNAYRIIMSILITAIVTFSVTSVLLYKTGKIQYITVSKTDTTGIGTILSSFKELLENKFLYNLDEENMNEEAIKAYISAAGDEYTVYYTPEEMKKFQTYTNGNYVGIGVYIIKNPKDNTVAILSPIKETPAEEAGLLPGDTIVKVDGKEYTGDETTAAANAIKGEEGTKVNLEILRDNKTFTIDIKMKDVLIE